ncbi:MAG TPA: hypothetical protein VF841_17335 [Anaeromyxobacter sp.]
MKVHRKYRVEECACRDPLRPNLTRPYLDAERKLLVATNGNALVAVPAEVDDVLGESSGYVDPAALKAARKAAGRKATSIEVATVDAEGQTFPAYEQVIPRTKAGDPDTVTFRFNANLLRDLLAGLGTDGSVTEMTLPLDPKRPGYADDLAPALVRNAAQSYDDKAKEWHDDAAPGEVAVLMQIKTRR